jgi:cyanate permease
MSKDVKKRAAVIVIGLVFMILFVGNYGQYQLSALPMDIFEKLGLTQNTQLTSLITAPMIPAILLGILSGTLADRFGIKKIVGVAVIIATIGLFIRPFATNYGIMLIGMILMGVGCAVVNANIAKIMASVVAVDKITKYIGIAMLGSTLSMAVCYSTSTLFPSLDSALWTITAVSVVVAICWLVLVRQKDFASGSIEQGEKVSMSESIKTALKSKNIWFMGIALAFILGTNITNTSFLVLALTGRGYSTATSGYVNTILTIGSIIGTFTGPLIISRLKSQKPALVVFGIIVALAAAFGWQLSIVPMCILLFLEGYCMSAMITVIVVFPVMFKEIGPKYAGAAGGVASTLQLLGAVILPTYVIVPLANKIGADGFTNYFYLGAASMVIAVIFLIFLPDMNRLMKKEG